MKEKKYAMLKFKYHLVTLLLIISFTGFSQEDDSEDEDDSDEDDSDDDKDEWVPPWKKD